MSLKRLTYLFLTLIIIAYLSSGVTLAQPGRGPTQSAQSSQKNEVKKAIVKRILSHARRMLSRANAVVERMDNILIRVKSRIAKFEASGKDFSYLNQRLQQIETRRKLALKKIEEATRRIDSLEGSNDPKKTVLDFVKDSKDVKDDLKEYHKSIVDVVKDVKGRSDDDDTDSDGQPTTSPGETPLPTVETTPTQPPVGGPSGTPPFFISPTLTPPFDNTPTPIGGIDYTIPVGNKGSLTINIGGGSTTITPTRIPSSYSPTPPRPTTTPLPTGSTDYTIPVGNKGSITINIQ